MTTYLVYHIMEMIVESICRMNASLCGLGYTGNIGCNKMAKNFQETKGLPKYPCFLPTSLDIHCVSHNYLPTVTLLVMAA